MLVAFIATRQEIELQMSNPSSQAALDLVTKLVTWLTDREIERSCELEASV